MEIKEISIEPQDKVDALYPYVEQVIQVLGHPEALVTDLSPVADFLELDWISNNELINERITKANEQLLKKARENLGVPVERGDLIVSVAERLLMKEGHIGEQEIDEEWEEVGLESWPEY